MLRIGLLIVLILEPLNGACSLSADDRTTRRTNATVDDLDKVLASAPIRSAIDSLEAAIDKDPGNRSLPLRRIEIVRRLRNEKLFEQASQEGERLLRYALGDETDKVRLQGGPSASFLLASIYEELGIPGEGRAVLDRAKAALDRAAELSGDSGIEDLRLRQVRILARWLLKHEGFPEADKELIEQQVRLESRQTQWSPRSELLSSWIFVVESRIELASEADRAELARNLSAELDAAISRLVVENPKSSRALIRLLEIRTAMVARTYRSDPNAAAQLLERTISAVDGKTFEDQAVVDHFRSRLVGYKQKIEAVRTAKELVGKVAPSVTGVRWANGEDVEWNSLRGKVVLIDFWAIWCAPCVSAFPEIASLDTRYHGLGLEVIGATQCYGFEWSEVDATAINNGNADATRECEAIDRFLKEKGVPFPSLVDEREGRLFKEFGVAAVPQLVVIDRRGVVRGIFVGHTVENERAVRGMVVKLLAE